MQWSSSISPKGLGSRKLSWFGRPRRSGDPLHAGIEALLGSNVQVRGDVHFSGGLRIDGEVTGDVVVSGVDAGTLTIGDTGRVHGHVRASHVVVYGQISGHVHATGLVDVRPQGRIDGDVHYGSLEMAAGGVIQGRLIRHPLQQDF